MSDQTGQSQVRWAPSSRTDPTGLLAVSTGEQLFWSLFEGSGPSLGRSPLAGKSVLVVEDEFLLADEIVDWLRARGANPVGPAESLGRAERLIEDLQIHCAVLDIRLGDELVFPVALELHRRGVPILFASAYAEEINYPAQLADVPRLHKPITERQLIGAVERMLD